MGVERGEALCRLSIVFVGGNVASCDEPLLDLGLILRCVLFKDQMVFQCPFDLLHTSTLEKTAADSLDGSLSASLACGYESFTMLRSLRSFSRPVVAAMLL